MKKTIILFGAILLFLHSNAQPGTLNTAFGGTGKVITSIGTSSEAQAIAVQPDGKVVVAGRTGNADPEIAVVRYQPDGTLDSSFGTYGVVIADITPGWGEAGNIAIKPNGKIIVVGTVDSASGGIGVIFQLSPSGSLDSSFGINGKQFNPLPTTLPGFWQSIDYSQFTDVVIQPDGKIVAAGFLGSLTALLVRYRENGTPDSTFGTNGVVKGASLITSGLVLQPDGKLAVAGFTQIGPARYEIKLARYNANGSLDPTFGYNGTTSALFDNEQVAGLALQPDGKLLVVGSAYLYQYMMVARFSAKGSFDSSFGVNGVVLLDFDPGGGGGAGYQNATSVAVQSDGKIIVAGHDYINVIRHVDFVVTRLNADGTTDSSFGTNGSTITPVQLDDYAYNMTLTANKIYMAGFSSPDFYSRSFTIVSYNNDPALLPLQLTSFTAQQQEKHVSLQWTITGEQEVNVYDIERSADGVLFSSRGKVEPRGPGLQQSYSFTDAFPSNLNYYRLKLLNKDGSFTYSKVIVVKMRTADDVSIFPNPAAGRLNIKFNSTGIGQITITDQWGHVVKRIAIDKAEENHFETIDISGLAKGCYILHAGAKAISFIKQ
jgi:uncharacterized delta-60 repeat protein